MAEPGNNAIETRGLAKSYRGKEVLHPVDLTVRGGETLVLIGHNGAGKTTLMKLLLGLTRPSAGKVQVLGEDPAAATAVGNRTQVGYLPENVVFPPAMTGLEVLAFYARLKDVPTSECAPLLTKVGLAEEAARRRVATYSKGMRQRLGLAQAMLGQPQLLVLDEPTTGLDPSLRHHFYRLIEQLRKDGATLLISSHALNEVEQHADRIAVLRQGSLVACGRLDELQANVSLPVHMRVMVAPGESARVAGQLEDIARPSRLNGQSLELHCDPDDQMRVIRRLGELGELVYKVEMSLPRLEDIYSHYINGDRLP